MKCKYPYLFSPLKLGNVILSNRIFSAPQGVPHAKLLSSTYYGGISLVDKANGGAGAVVVSSYGPADIANEKSPFDKYAMDVTRETLTVIENAGATGIMEFSFHPSKNKNGLMQMPMDTTAFTGEKGYALSKEEMIKIIDGLCTECKKAKDFGFRMIMLHFGHDSFHSEFLSPVWNKRNDEYGGNLENRIRFPKEAITKIRSTLGKDYPIMMRVSRQLIISETYSEDDMLYFIDQVKDLVDIFNISAGMDCYGGVVEHYEANVHAHTTPFEPRNYNFEFAKRVKKETGAKVCLVGGVNDPKFADEAIKNGELDAVMLGRQLIADPYWPNKAKEGKDEDIVPCIRCLSCYHIATKHADVECSVNPRFRRENRVPLKLEKTDSPKKVVVVGAGPSGMESALTASKKGHKVILVEKEGYLGGKLALVGEHKYKKDLIAYRDYLIKQVQKSDIDVRLNTCLKRDYLEKLDPDYLIICIGGDFITPRIEGVEYAHQAIEFINKGLDSLAGKTIIVGGGAIGAELALELGEAQKEVAIVEMGDSLVAKENYLYKLAFNQHLKKCDKVDVYLNSQVIKIEKGRVLIRNKEKEEWISGDNILLAVGLRPLIDEAYDFYGITPNTFVVGDCKRVANVKTAINDAFLLANSIE